MAIAREAVVLTETSGAATRQIAIAHPIAAVGFADQIWVAHGTVPMLSRFAITGKPIGAPLALAAGDGTLVAAPVAA
ncbi:MAG: hypothetical protein ABI867_20060, partial [Kofleriaceae bacterium]